MKLSRDDAAKLQRFLGDGFQVRNGGRSDKDIHIIDARPYRQAGYSITDTDLMMLCLKRAEKLGYRWRITQSLLDGKTVYHVRFEKYGLDTNSGGDVLPEAVVSAVVGLREAYET